MVHFQVVTDTWNFRDAMKILHYVRKTKIRTNFYTRISHIIIWFNRADKSVHKNIIVQLFCCLSYSLVQTKEWCICTHRNNVRKLFHTWIHEWKPHGICFSILYMDSSTQFNSLSITRITYVITGFKSIVTAPDVICDYCCMNGVFNQSFVLVYYQMVKLVI